MDIKFEMVEHRKILNKNGPTKNRSNKVEKKQVEKTFNHVMLNNIKNLLYLC